MSLFRAKENSPPKIFKVWDHTEDHVIVEEAMEEAIKNRAQLDIPLGRTRFIRHYNRNRLAMASTLDIMTNYDVITPKTEPADTDMFPNWLNTLANKSMALRSAPILTFKRPLVMDMIIAPNNFV